jgi:hypothetical protein
MKAALSCCGALCLAVAMLPAASEHGVTAEIVPAQVKPGDLFELRVEMSRADYASFELEIPTHERLHRVAVESVPVRFEDGCYRQGEVWFLQADSSGEVVIDGATVLLEGGSGPVTVELPTLRVGVVAYGEQDESAEPALLPAAPSAGGAWWGEPSLVFVVLILAVLALAFVTAPVLVIRWIAKRRDAAEGEGVSGKASWEEGLADLDSGMIESPALERLFLEQGGCWSGELRAAVEAAVYAGRGEAGRLAAMLRKEVAR